MKIFLDMLAKFKSERARTALIKNKARQIIRELAPKILYTMKN